MAPDLSVVTVTRNLISEGRKAAFERGFRALHGQRGLSFEQIFIDGASDDGTQDLIAALCRQEAKGAETHLVSEPDAGIYDAMNKGAARASGRFLMFYNSDDLLLGEDRLAKAVAALDTARADYLYGRKVVERADGSERTWTRMSPDNVLHMVPFGHGALITTRAAFADLGGLSTAYRVYADYDFMFRLIAGNYRGIFFPEEMVRFASGGLSDTWEGRAEEFARVWTARVSAYVDLTPFDADDVQSWLSTKIFPAQVLDAIERGPNTPDPLRAAARTCRWISRRRRLKRAFGRTRS